MSTPGSVPRDETEVLRRTIDALPVGVLNVGAEGTIRRASDRIGEMLRLPLTEVVGRSVLDFVHPDDLDAAITMLGHAARYGSVMGPVRLRYVDGDGQSWITELWGNNALDDPDLQGYLLVFTPESIHDGLAAASRAIADGRPPIEAFEELTTGLARHPMTGAGSLLLIDGDQLRLIGAWPLTGWVPVPTSLADVEPDAPWSVTLRTGDPVDGHDDDTLPSWLLAPMTEAGLPTLCSRAVVGRAGNLVGVLLSWLSDAGPPSENQRRWIDEVVAMAALASDQAAHRRALETDVLVDPLTGLGNRRRLLELFDDADPGISGLLYLDLDGFKAVNDQLGHLVGDEVLRQVGTRLAKAVRDDDVAIRMGGDEFAVVCRSPTGVDGLVAIAERLASVLATPFAPRGEVEHDPIHLTASIGIAPTTGDTDQAILVARADRAMYRAKADRTCAWALADEH